MSNQAGKGDKPRNCYSKEFKNNYSEIDWKPKKKLDKSSKNSQNSPCERKASEKSSSNS
jgi:hypothetical protein